MNELVRDFLSVEPNEIAFKTSLNQFRAFPNYFNNFVTSNIANYR